ncbi:MAG: DegT/DnrJ/EryC1/StrS family aminotransferase [Planctomycetota bacterium]|nr:DegT/DnrJ/EryC1/StrS family aminotransferase [Planctomycetota bacterium]
MPEAPADFRSDTVTLPTPEMREAMARAEVGDDVFGDDPTVKELEARAAALVGKEAAIFVPSGCMANLIAIMAQAPAGTEMLVAENSHVHTAESAAYARVAQVTKWPLKVDRFGRLDPQEIARNVRKGYGLPGGNSHHATTSLLCLENTNNFCGGTVQAPADLRRAVDAARAQGPWIKVHLDGARLFNAAVALGVPAREIAAVADSVSFCLSKGLSAPVGSLICGTKADIDQAHALRKMLGGGMRQAGVLAACGLISISEPMIARLAEDHANCRRLAEGLAELPGVTADLETVQTNILFFGCQGPKGGAAWLVKALEAEGVRCLALGERVRMVTHRGVTRAHVDEALRAAGRLLK